MKSMTYTITTVRLRSISPLTDRLGEPSHSESSRPPKPSPPRYQRWRTADIAIALLALSWWSLVPTSVTGQSAQVKSRFETLTINRVLDSEEAFNSARLMTADRSVAIKDYTQTILPVGSVVVYPTGKRVAAIQLDDRVRYVLPIETVTESGSVFPSVIDVSGGGFRPSEESLQRYNATVYVGLDADQPTAVPDINFLVATHGGSAQPDQFAVKKSGLPFVKVDLATTALEDSATVQVLSDAGEVVIKIPMLKPALSVTVAPDTIHGFGLGTSTITVNLDDLPENAVLPLAVTASHGYTHGDEASITSAHPATLTLRSAWFGTSEILVKSVPSGAAVSATAVVTFAVPWLYLGLILLGSILGGFLSRSMKESFVKGFLLGLAAALFVAAGVQFDVIELPDAMTEALVVGVAIVGGMLLPKVMRGRPKQTTSGTISGTT